jgi:hypothetical protein
MLSEIIENQTFNIYHLSLKINAHTAICTTHWTLVVTSVVCRLDFSSFFVYFALRPNGSIMSILNSNEYDEEPEGDQGSNDRSEDELKKLKDMLKDGSSSISITSSTSDSKKPCTSSTICWNSSPTVPIPGSAKE